MTTAAFWASALALAGLAWSLLFVGPRRVPAGRGAATADTALLDEGLAGLDAERAAGGLDAARHREAVVDLQRRWLAEAVPSNAVASPSPAASPRLLALLAVALPAFVIGGYLALGNPAALHVEPPPPVADAVSPADVERMVDTLAQRLQSRPAGQSEDLPGWVMLARSQAALQRFDAAAAAYERAVALAPNDAQLLADLADVLTMTRTSAPRGPSEAATTPSPAAGDRATELIERALALDPRNPKALALAGNAAADRRDTAAAIGYWQRARAVAPPGSEFAAALERNLADAGAGASPSPAAVAGTGATSIATLGATHAPAAGGRTIVGDIRIAPALAGRIGPGDTLFVFARAVDGPRMPLAILRRPAATVPGPFTLDDSMAMSPEMRLSNFDAVVVGARISRSGEALPQSGDLVGEFRADKGSGRVEVVIDRVQP